MSDVIWKYPLKITGRQEIELPRVYRLLSVQVQDGALTLWALVKPDFKPESIPIYIVGTGHPIHNLSPEEYVSTVQLDGFVWHVFGRRYE